MKSRFHPAIAAMAIASVLVGACGGSATPAPTVQPATAAPTTAAPATPAASAAGKTIIGDILYNDDAYQTAQQKQMQAYADKLGIQIVFENQLGKGTNAPNLMDDLLAKGVQGIIYQPADAAVSVPLVQQAQAKKIPVLGWAIPFGTGVTAPYIGLAESDQTKAAGARAAQWVKDNFPGQPVKVLIVTIAGVSICTDVRMGPFTQGVLSVAPDAKIVTVDGAGSREKAVTVSEDALQRESGFNIATGCNSDMAFGALQAFKAANLGAAVNKKPTNTYFYSINGTDEELKALVDPTSPVMEVLGLTPKEISQTLIDTLLKMMKGDIDPYGTYTANVPDLPIIGCQAANDFNKTQYFATTDLPCGAAPATPAASAAGKTIIGDILYNDDAYQTAQQKQMQAYADKLGIQIVFENQLGKGTNAPNLMDDLLAKGVQGIIYQPADAAVSVPLVQQAQAKKIPVLGWAIPFGTGVTAPYIGLAESDQTKAAGARAAQWVKDNFPGQPVKVLIVTIAGVSICTDVRMGPFTQGVLSVAPDAKIVTVDGAGSREKAVTVSEDALQRESGFNIATGCNSDMAFGALQAFKAANLGAAVNKKPTNTYFYSINGTDEELKALVDPTSPVMEVLGLTPKEISQTLIDTLLKMMKGDIDPYGTYTANVPDLPIIGCQAANDFNKTQYFATTDLPCK